MGFLTPASFWFLSFIGILILFYFFKKQYDRHMISSVYLWNQTVKEWETNRWWRKLQHSLLLLLQALVMLFLIFALARPFINGNGVSGDHLVIVMDTSASMDVQLKDGTRFEEAKSRAISLVNELKEGQAVTLINAKRVPKLVDTRTLDHRTVKNDIRHMKLSYEHADMTSSIRLADSLAGSGGEVVVFSDDLSQKDLADLHIKSKIVVRNIGKSQSNLSLHAFGVGSDSHGVSAIVSVKNEADRARLATIGIEHDGKLLKKVKKQIPAGKLVTFTVSDLPQEKVYSAVIENKDSYSLDNRRWAFLSVKKPETLFLVGDVNPFLQKALQFTGANIVQVSTLKTGTVQAPKENRQAIYVLSGVDAKKWPKGAKLIVSPALGGPFQIGMKTTLAYPLKMVQEDPMLHYVNVENVYLGNAYSVGDLQDLTPLIVSGDNPIVSKGRYKGDRTVLMNFAVKDSDWPLHPSFPILVQNAITYLSSEAQSLGYLNPGEEKAVSLSPTVTSAKIETAAGKTVSDSAVDIHKQTFRAPSSPGLYRLVEETADGERIRPFAVMLDGRELTEQATDSFTLTTHGPRNENVPSEIVSREYWRWAALVALILLFMEWEVYRRGTTSR
ncbi:MAG TPA: BatA and WFA domain-containing protein [Bacillales bacterium]|nr:BatA and WFA domain-containing protein [Bacillales bacterium]